MKRLVSLLCVIMLLVACIPAASADTGYGTLADGITPVDAVTVLSACALVEGVEPDIASLSISGDTVTVPAGIFTLSVVYEGNVTTAASISCGYLDADYALSMGKIAGVMLAQLGGITDAADIVSSLDFNAFNKLEPNTQTLISGDYKVILTVDPNAANCYAITLKLRDPSKLTASASDPLTAAEILRRMGLDLSGYEAYTAETDTNGVLGTPGGYTSKVNFSLTSLDPVHTASSYDVEQGGSIEVFATAADAIARINKVLTTESTYFGWTEYMYLSGTTVLRLSHKISADEAGFIVSRFMHAAADAGYTAEGSATAAATAMPVITPAPTAVPTPAPVPAVSVGDTITLGHYEQDNNTSNGKEAIEWIVLKVDGDAALCVSTYALDVYNTNWSSPTWDKSTIRTWSNSTFLNNAFSADEQAVLLIRTVSADKNPNYSSDPGKNTEDAVFCLSYAEAQSLMTAAQRKAKVTDYARKARGVYTEGGLCYWWLRSPGKPNCGAAIVCTDGSFDYDVSYDGFSYGFRPAIWVDLNKLNGSTAEEPAVVLAPAAPDYADAASYEAALNNGANTVGKTVRFKVDNVKPNSAFGFNMWAGQHLNMITDPFDVKAGDEVTVRITRVDSQLASWIVYCEVVK